jgi:hypothetical protein
MGNIKLKDLVFNSNLNESDTNALDAMANALKGREDLVKLALQTAKKSEHPIAENIMKNPKVLKKIASILLMAGLNAPSDLNASDVQTKIKQIFSNPQYTQKSEEQPPVRFIMPPSDHAYNKGAGEEVPPPYDQSDKKKSNDSSQIIFNDEFVNKMADAIYKAEGGTKAKSPYGVLSINLKGKTPEAKKAEARQITINSIRNNWKRWLATDKTKDFVDFMADRWCPISADPVGNRNWKSNVKKFMGIKSR